MEAHIQTANKKTSLHAHTQSTGFGSNNMEQLKVPPRVSQIAQIYAQTQLNAMKLKCTDVKLRVTLFAKV